MSKFSIRLKIALEKANMKPSVLAYRLGVERSTISNYLNDKYKAKSEMLSKMAQILSVSAAWLDGFDVPMDYEYSPEEPKLSEGEEMLLNLFRRVPEEQQQLVLQMIRVALGSQE